MPLPLLPPTPSRDDPTTFAAKAEAFLAALSDWGDAANALEQSLQLVATTGTSTTSLAIGSGSKSLTTQAGKAWVVGAYVHLVSAASVANRMVGQITAYDSATGALSVNVATTAGTGTFASWIVGLATATAAASDVSVVDAGGYFVASSVETVLQEIGAYISAIPWSGITGKPTSLDGYGITDAYFVGDTKHSWQTSDHGRWLLLTTAARTIGSAASGATARANADTLALYTQLWNTMSNTDCPVSGGRGVSAGADFAANKTLQLPLMSGLTLKGHHGGDGTLTTDTSRALGSYEADANKAHTHSFAGSSGPGGTNQISSTTGQAPGFVTTSSNGGLEALVRNRSINIFIYR